MVQKGQVLSNDFQVCVTIYEYNKNNEKIWFNKLVKAMNGTPTQSTISKCIDRLFDRGMINGKWECVDGRWTRTLEVTGEFEGFIKSLYTLTSENLDQ